MALHPEVAFRDCGDCAKYTYDHDKGVVCKLPNGEPMLRIKGERTPCRYGKDRCAKGTPETSRALTTEGEAIWSHYLECRATGQFPDDPLVRRHAAIIYEVERQIDRADMRMLTQSVMASMARR